MPSMRARQIASATAILPILAALLLAACSGSGSSSGDSGPGAAARAGFETWVGQLSVAYRNASYATVSQSEGFATVKVTVEFQSDPTGPWQAQEATVRVVKQGSTWQPPTSFTFGPTQSAKQTQEAIVGLTATAGIVQAQATQAVVSLTKEAESTAESVAAEATGTAKSAAETQTASVPTPTPEPTNTPVPTNTPIPTPTPIPNTEEGTTLQVGQSWVRDGLLVTVADPTFIPGCRGFLGFSLIIQNTTGSELVVNFSGKNVTVSDDAGTEFPDTWAGKGEQSPDCYFDHLSDLGFQALAAESSQEYGVRVLGTTSTDAVAYYVTVSIGNIQDAAWQITVPR